MAKALTLGGKPFSLRPTRKVCMGMGGAMVLILGSCGGLWFWQNDDLEARGKIIRDKVDQVEHGERVARRLDEVKQEQQKVQSKLRFLESSVSPGTYVPTMLNQVADLAKAEKLDIVKFEPKSEPPPLPPTDPEAKKKFHPQPYDMWRVNMQVQGTYWSVARFVNRLTQFQKIVAQDSVQLMPLAAVEGTPPQLNATLKFTGFAFHDDTKPLAVPADLPLLGRGAGTERRALENQVINNVPAPQGK